MVKGQLCRGMSKGLHYRPVVNDVAFDETSFDRKKGAKTVSLKIDQLISATFSITPLSLSLSLSLFLALYREDSFTLQRVYHCTAELLTQTSS